MKNIFKIITMSMFLVLMVGCGKTNSYTITFDSNGGSNVDKIVITEEEQLKLPKEPTREGYIFNGWLLNGKLFNESTKIDKDITLKADWISDDKKTYKVVFIFNNNTKDLEINVEENTKISKPSNPTKEGYKFLGWYLDNDTYDFDKEINSDIILFAKWEEQKRDNTSNNSSNNNNSNSNVNNNTNNNDNSSDNNSSNNTDKEIKTENAKVSYSCYDSSYKLSGDKCIKSINVDSTKEYYCESGYSLNGTTCTKNITTTDEKEGEPIYTCIDGMFLNNNKCEHHTISQATAVYSCPSGLSLEGTLCYSYTYKKTNSVTLNDSWSETTKSSYYNTMQNTCSGDVKWEGNVISCWEYVKELEQYASSSWTCPSGYTLVDGACDKVLRYDPVIMGYNCPSGYSNSGSKCIKKSYSTDKVSAKYKYTCPSGYTLSNDTCKKEFSIDANKEYSCPKNYTLKGSICYSN